MYGLVIGDIAGSLYEFRPVKRKDIELFPTGCGFTDDTIMGIAVARALIEYKTKGGWLKALMIQHMKKLGKEYPYPKGSYGGNFKRWLRSDSLAPYNSYGNGSAMRVGACGIMAESLQQALDWATVSAEVTHNHPEGINGAQATAAAVYLAKTGSTKEEIKAYIHENFYSMDRTLDEIRPDYGFDPSCQGTVPESIIAFLESDGFEDAIRNTISLGGDADTMGAITGSIAWSYYKVQNNGELMDDMLVLKENAVKYLPKDFIMTVEKVEELTNR